MTKKRAPRRHYSDADVDDIVARRGRGDGWGSIAADYGRSASTLQNVVHKYRGTPVVVVSRACALAECSEIFTAQTSRARYCCRKHQNRDTERRRRGEDISFVECALPECTRKRWVTHCIGELLPRRYCCRSHSEAHTRRLRLGIYERWQQKSPSCEVCGEWAVVDEHHEVFLNNKSDKSSKTHVLCPSCHSKVHCDLVRYENGRFVDRIPAILADLT